MNIFFLKKNFFRILMAGISLIALSTHASTHFISGFVATQPVAIPNVYLIDANNFVAKDLYRKFCKILTAMGCRQDKVFCLHP
jgi:hypothetical protein